MFTALRRRARRWNASAVLCSALVALSLPTSLSQPSPDSFGDTSFHSSPILPPAHYAHTPPQPGTAPGLYTFLGVRGSTSAAKGNMGPYILDERGEVVWYGGTKSVLNVGRHTYKGEPVLAFYTGSEEYPGYGHGQWQIYNESYALVAVVEAAGMGSYADPHDFSITPSDTAIIEYWHPRPTDLSAVGGLRNGFAFDCTIQEVDVETGELVWEWHALDHIDVAETFYSVEGGAGTEDQPFDAHHLNSVQKDDAGNFLISLRGSSTLYYIDRFTGEILWRIGKWNSDLPMTDKTLFHFQHHARLHGSGLSPSVLLSVFSNGANQYTQTAPIARGLLLRLDTEKKEVELVQEFLPSFGHASSSEGSVEVLENGNVVVGWGITPYYSEYLPNGTRVQDIQFGAFVDRAQNDHSYRVYKAPWVGKPLTRPSLALDNSTPPSPPSTAFVSWNGATQVASWRILIGSSPSQLYGIDEERTTRTGFETRLEMPWAAFEEDQEEEPAAFVAVVAYDREGQPIGASEVLDASTGEGTGIYPDLSALWYQDRRRKMQAAGAVMILLAGALFLAHRHGLFSRNKTGYAPLLGSPTAIREAEGWSLRVLAHGERKM
ncbi:hypothetical protein JCM8547_002251 [Rhodosporidiobolus lusitaniae]